MAKVKQGDATSIVKVLLHDASSGKLLLLQPGSDNPWELPGGRIEKGESPAQAAARELQEETGIVIPVASFIAVDKVQVPGIHAMVLYARLGEASSETTPRVRISPEHTDYLWVSVEKTPSLDCLFKQELIDVIGEAKAKGLLH